MFLVFLTFIGDISSSVTLPDDASAALIVVDNVRDRLKPGSVCITMPTDLGDDVDSIQGIPGDILTHGRTRNCTLRAGEAEPCARANRSTVVSRTWCTRAACPQIAAPSLSLAALSLAGTIENLDVIIAVRAGRHRLVATLPEVTGKVRIIGSRGRSLSSGESKSLPSGGGALTADTSASDPWAQLRLDRADDVDPAFTGRQPGQITPIGTTIDGDEIYQLMRSAHPFPKLPTHTHT